MHLLRYFIIEKKIFIPDVVYSTGGVDEPLNKFTLEEILNTEDFEYANLKINNHEFDRSDIRKAKREVLNYLEELNNK